MGWDYKDNRGKMHSSQFDSDLADREYANEEKDHRQNLETAAKYGAIQSARAAEAAEKQNALLAEQNELLMMTPEERAAYKERLEEAKRQEQRRKARKAQEQAELQAREAQKLAEKQAYESSPEYVGNELEKLEEKYAAKLKTRKILLYLSLVGMSPVFAFLTLPVDAFTENDSHMSRRGDFTTTSGLIMVLVALSFFTFLFTIFGWISSKGSITKQKAALNQALDEEKAQIQKRISAQELEAKRLKEAEESTRQHREWMMQEEKKSRLEWAESDRKRKEQADKAKAQGRRIDHRKKMESIGGLKGRIYAEIRRGMNRDNPSGNRENYKRMGQAASFECWRAYVSNRRRDEIMSEEEMKRWLPLFTDAKWSEEVDWVCLKIWSEIGSGEV
jgi:hypothetical protein